MGLGQWVEFELGWVVFIGQGGINQRTGRLRLGR